MRRRSIAALAAGAAALALVVGVSIVWPGLDAQETPEVDTSVWALQTGEGRRYARVNTSIGELDTVRSVSNPSSVAQSADGAFLFSDSFSKLTRIDEALPRDLDDEALRSSESTPAGTTDVVTAGDFVAYRTDAGTVHAGRLSAGDAAQLDPFASDGDDEDTPPYTADALTVNSEGMLFAYSSADESVLRYDLRAGEVRGRDPLAAEVASPAVTAAGEVWAVVDRESGEVLLRGRNEPVDVGLAGDVRVGAADPNGDAVYLADETGLVTVSTEGAVTAEVERGATVLGTPADPIVHDGEVLAAWLGPADGGGTLWSSRSGETALDYGGETIPDERRPVFVATGEAVILNETRTGWVWTAPDGALVASSQDWSLDDRLDPAAVPSEEQLSVVLDPKPPIAEADAFGVRAGRLATLPVLLNDHDPNEDVLSVDPASVSGLDPGFGVVTVTDDGQRLAVRLEPGASGSASFQYVVTDGTAADGLRSEPASVTLTVSEGDGAPQWCGVEGCLVLWPTPEVARGGTVTVPVLPGWVDPDGDPLLLLSVDNPAGIGTVASTPAGDIVYQHADDGSGGEQLIELNATVADTSGQMSTKPLLVRVSPDPALAVQSFAVIDTVGAGLIVDVAPHVTGTAGTLAVTSVRVLDDAAATATVLGGTTTFDFTAADPGTYRVGFTVTDGRTDATGTARITVLPADAPAQLATSPVVAFVHPQQDATLDVFAAVSNPTRRVLLLSEVVATADDGATLSVDAVGQNNLRVSGTTDSGAPGRLGTVTYTVSDGTEDAGARVGGEATVYLLPPAPEIAPIAVDDAVTVRAGAQIDIPVLDNDISPAGGRPSLDPSTVTSTDADALAFSSGGVLRYLAPLEPGDYGVDYSVYTTGSPALRDTASVRIRVLPEDENRAPSPRTLEGRVLSGGTTSVEFDGFGMDPDGDVVTLDRILEQPERGSANISADGASIVYNALPGDRGQVSFRYRVEDAAGTTGEGTVRIGVLDIEANPSPVTFTDYVEVQAGEDNTIRVSPLANDIDPTQGTLSLTDVRPDLPAVLTDGSANPEHARIEEHILSVNDTEVVLAAGEEPATMSFLYDVESDSGNTGRGLVVVRVVRESVPDYPIVSDTVLSVENREEFESGVDVLTGKAAWSRGDVADLDVSLWGEPEGVEAEGRRLSGPLPARTRVIPFAVTGTVGEEEVTTYAFLRVPGDDDLDLALRTGTPPQEVPELESVSFDMADLVALPRGATLEVGDDVRASGARAEAGCARESGTGVRYDAGAGAPWTDSCQVPVRLEGTEEWTSLSVPLTVVARDPQPELRPGSLTVGPGETATFDLRNMTTWQLAREDWDAIQYSLEPAGAAFEVSLSGSIVTVVGADRAVPGTETAALVGVTSHPSVAPARLALRVGAAPSALPQGGAVTQQCSQASGSSCTIPVIGAGGEVNPLPRTPLEVVDVRPTGVCVGVSFRVASATAVAASWTGDAPGATCTASFSVRDAQGRTTASERDGRILLDLQGFPKAPASVRQTAYGDGTVTLRVDAGESRLAYPALTGFVVRSAGVEVARCSADGTCPVIPAPNGEQRVYEAWAVNGVGESRASVRTTAWAYDTPGRPANVSWAPVPNGNDGGLIELTITGIDAAETGSLQIASATGETQNVPIGRNQDSVDLPRYRVGTNVATAVTITPVSRYSLPPGLGGRPNGDAYTVEANGVGAPLDLSLALSSRSDGDGTSTVTAQAAARVNGSGSQLRYGIVLYNERFRCDPRSGGEQASFSGLPDGDEYRFFVCAESVYGDRAFGTAQAEASVRAVQSDRAPQGWTFRVDPQPTISGQEARWSIIEQPTSTETPPRRNSPEFNTGFPPSPYGTDPGIQVRYVHEWWGPTTAWAPVRPASGSAPFQVNARWSATCIGGSDLQRSGQSSNAPSGQSAAITFTNANLRYYDASNQVLPHTADTWLVPVGATRVDGIRVSVDWSALGWSLNGVQNQQFSVSCDPNNPVPPPAEPPVVPAP